MANNVLQTFFAETKSINEVIYSAEQRVDTEDLRPVYDVFVHPT